MGHVEGRSRIRPVKKVGHLVRIVPMSRLSEWVDDGTTILRIAYESDIRYLATSFAYYAFLSFIPLLVLVVAGVGWQFARSVSTPPAQFLTPDAQRLVYNALTTASGRTGAAVLSIFALAWGGANVATGVLTTVERIETASERSLSSQVRDAVVVLGALSLAMLSILLQSLVFTVFSAGALGILAGFAILLVVLTVAFLPLYYVPSRIVDSVSGAVPGAFTTACGWTVIHAGIQFYALNAAQYAIYGVLSGIIIILTTIYLAAVVLLMGIVVNAALATDPEDLLTKVRE